MKLIHSLLAAAVVAQTTVSPETTVGGLLDPRGRGGKKKAQREKGKTAQ